MKRKLCSIVFFLLFATALPLGVRAAEALTPVGSVIGLQLRDGTVTVAAYDDILGGSARDAGLKIGDVLLKIDGAPVTEAVDVRAALENAGQTLTLTVRRGVKEVELTMAPVESGGEKKLGVYLRQGVAGIGTVTFYDPATDTFGALGHGVSDPRGGILEMSQGYAYPAVIQDVKKGAAGEPGQLKGQAVGSDPMGVLSRNTPQGIFGRMNGGFPGDTVPLAEYGEIHTGPAAIRSTVSGDQVREYSVEILKIYPEDRPDGRNFLLKVTDPALLEATGGIVQGMSGSPILQDGKFVGAVTHVLVGDATVGYGIYIGNMLNAAA